LALSRAIDAMNQRIAFIAEWLVLLSCLISAGNAFSRYCFNISSNAWLGDPVVHVRRGGSCWAPPTR
jgi:TRAP-type mannitol/chloroaromatic compound transport system permease small subunit